ncbi:LETM1 domain-containing protein 1 isoform X2 [Cylas formicarius]|uniref:LETM1 domain-containing protein 1 isoform X2 n=1 Tax=Cylas formicarius TaxID=197179 RepID=UPI0029584230|nr:LETM1 domain-containing protein 1 isoform X2 [Cylas formicarius]
MLLPLGTTTCRLNLNRILTFSIFKSRVLEARSLSQKSVYKREEAKKIRFYLLTRFIDYLKNYDKVLEKNFPTTMLTYRTFTDGIKDFIADTREYFKIVLLLNASSDKFTKLLRRDIELYQQMPKDMIKVAPTLLVSSLPFALYVTLPMIYYFPKQLLSSHFWTLNQKSKFKTEYLAERLKHNRPILRHLQLQIGFLKREKLQSMFKPWTEVLGTLGSGTQPTVEQILTCKELFSGEPYHLMYLSRNHVKHLLKLHDLHMGWFRRTRLSDRANILIEMDRAIMREGGVHNLPQEALRNSCYIRGLNPSNVSREHLVKWLTQWIKISSQINQDNLSLLLHCPVLLGYNEPSNWMLIYEPKFKSTL